MRDFFDPPIVESEFVLIDRTTAEEPFALSQAARPAVARCRHSLRLDSGSCYRTRSCVTDSVLESPVRWPFCRGRFETRRSSCLIRTEPRSHATLLEGPNPYIPDHADKYGPERIRDSRIQRQPRQ